MITFSPTLLGLYVRLLHFIEDIDKVKIRLTEQGLNTCIYVCGLHGNELPKIYILSKITNDSIDIYMKQLVVVGIAILPQLGK